MREFLSASAGGPTRPDPDPGPSRSYVGADGCRAGWFYVRLSESGHTAGVAPDAATLLDLHSTADAILIDIPIGLRGRETAERSCDRLARRMLVPRRSASVFHPPCRPALSCGTYEEANGLNRRLTGRGLSRQSWAIAPRIREVDDLLGRSSAARSLLREAHPEVCFLALGGGAPMRHNKRTEEGARERVAVLRALFPASDRVIAACRPLPGGVGTDDVVDALCLAVTGFLGRHQLRSIPDEPEIDERGLPMEMAFFEARAPARPSIPRSA